jgi:hypothetical protein
MRRLLCLGLLVAALCSGVFASDVPVTVRLRPSARVTDEEVRLGEVASLSGPVNTVRALREVVVLRHLAPGDVQRLAAGQILAALAAAGFDVQRIVLSGAKEVVVRRVGTAQVASPEGVSRGAAVRVVAAIGGIRVWTTGVTLQAGEVGELVRVRILTTRREVVCRVVEPGLVAVEF